MLIRYQTNIIVSDQYLIDNDPRVFAIWEKFNTVWFHLNYLQNTYSRYPIHCPWGQGIGCTLWWSYSLIRYDTMLFTPLWSLRHYINQSFYWPKTSHASISQPSYGMSTVMISEKNECIIISSHTILCVQNLTCVLLTKGLVQERCNSIANALELRLSCIDLSIYS